MEGQSGRKKTKRKSPLVYTLDQNQNLLCVWMWSKILRRSEQSDEYNVTSKYQTLCSPKFFCLILFKSHAFVSPRAVNGNNVKIISNSNLKEKSADKLKMMRYFKFYETSQNHENVQKLRVENLIQNSPQVWLTIILLTNHLLLESFFGMIEGKKTAGRPRTSYLGQIQHDAKVKTFKEFKEKANLERRASNPTLSLDFIVTRFFLKLEYMKKNRYVGNHKIHFIPEEQFLDSISILYNYNVLQD
ncbi:hypothetical protein AGLY_006984 [Aphis glycines]|uniref:Uncharacterized protein n=1 Tax=Aphis glycines TaxID=307491 RepID=A0A6G0TS30_APHGL|nr:hypothetical protein AGLY_006984 [Aphis glycines]